MIVCVDIGTRNTKNIFTSVVAYKRQVCTALDDTKKIKYKIKEKKSKF